MMSHNKTNKTMYSSKLVLLGETGVGKTSIAFRYVQDKFVKYQESTIGAGFLSKIQERPEHMVKYEIWDTAGQERYRALVPLYYRGANIAIIVYDITAKPSFQQAKIWVNRVQKEHPTCKIYLVRNKLDHPSKRIIHKNDALAYADDKNIVFMEVSAKTKDNIEELFNVIADEIPKLPPTINPNNTFQLENNNDDDSYYNYYLGGCCSG